MLKLHLTHCESWCFRVEDQYTTTKASQVQLAPSYKTQIWLGANRVQSDEVGSVPVAELQFVDLWQPLETMCSIVMWLILWCSSSFSFQTMCREQFWRKRLDTWCIICVIATYIVLNIVVERMSCSESVCSYIDMGLWPSLPLAWFQR